MNRNNNELTFTWAVMSIPESVVSFTRGFLQLAFILVSFHVGAAHHFSTFVAMCVATALSCVPGWVDAFLVGSASFSLARVLSWCVENGVKNKLKMEFVIGALYHFTARAPSKCHFSPM